jgi:antitoxin component of MazEF toxin-antitoxin module
MSLIQLRFDGWLTLPAKACDHLGVTTGHLLQVELIDDALLLRPAEHEAAPPEPEIEEASGTAAPAEQMPAEADTAVLKRGRGRPRTQIVQELAPQVRVGGRSKSSRST